MALIREKFRDYRNATFFQVALLLIALPLQDLLEDIGGPELARVAWFFFHAGVAGYAFFLVHILSHFTDRRDLLRATAALLVVAYAAGVVVNNTPALEHLRFLGAGSFIVGLGVQMMVVRFALRDVLVNRTHVWDKLWGSACIYLMVAFAFATLFHILQLLRPDLFGETVTADFETFYRAILLSLNSLFPVADVYPNASRLINNLRLLEGLWGQLYLVLLISGMLMPPDEKEEP